MSHSIAAAVALEAACRNLLATCCELGWQDHALAFSLAASDRNLASNSSTSTHTPTSPHLYPQPASKASKFSTLLFVTFQ